MKKFKINIYIKKLITYILLISVISFISFYSILSFMKIWGNEFLEYNKENIFNNEKYSFNEKIINYYNNINKFIKNEDIFERKYLSTLELKNFMIKEWFNNTSINEIIQSWLKVKLFNFESNQSYYIKNWNQINLFWSIDYNNFDENTISTLKHELIHKILDNSEYKNNIALNNIKKALKNEKDVIKFIMRKEQIYTKEDFRLMYEKSRYSIISKIWVLTPLQHIIIPLFIGL